MKYISQIFVRKSLGAWGSPITFQSFYFSYDNKEVLIQDSTMVKCIDQDGEILSKEEVFPIYREMEKMLIEQNNNLNTSPTTTKKSFKFNFQ